MGPLRLTYGIYALQALSLLVAVVGQGLLATQLLFLLPALAAVVLGFIARGRVQGTYLAPHVAWQLRTAWVTAAILAAATLVLGPFVLLGLALSVHQLLISPLQVAYLATAIWTAYRIVRGVLALRGGRDPTPRTLAP